MSLRETPCLSRHSRTRDGGPCGAAHLLVSRLGTQRSREFILFGGRLSAEEAYELGIVNRVVDPDGLEAEANEMVARLASGPTIAIGLSKRPLNRMVGADRATRSRMRPWRWKSTARPATPPRVRRPSVSGANRPSSDGEIGVEGRESPQAPIENGGGSGRRSQTDPFVA